jgi:hypothetical protein
MTVFRFRRWIACTCVLIFVATAIAGCSGSPAPPAAGRAPAALPPIVLAPNKPPAADPGAPVADFFGKGDRVYLPPAVAFWEVRTETTPTAAAVARALVAMGERYAGKSPVQFLRVFLPEASRAERMVLDLTWNTGDRPVQLWKTPGHVTTVPAHAVFVWVGFGSDIIASTAKDQPAIPFASSATTEALRAGSTQVLRQLRGATGLP